jgi:glucose/arabinose dehydrogenase
LGGCGQDKPLPKENFGPRPQLPAPHPGLIPTANFSTAKPWPPGAAPHAPAGFTVTRFAEGLDHPRWIYVLPCGDVLVAESSTEPRPPNSLMDRLGDWLQRNNNTIRRSADRITLLRDANGDGVVKTRTAFLTGVKQPFGMALIGTSLYVAGTGGLWRYSYHEGDTRLSGPGEKIIELPVGGYNNHWTRNVVANATGSKLYITVGSGSNAGEHGEANEEHRANVLECNPDGSGLRVHTAGMRNPVGLGWEPTTQVLWTVVNERDMLGDDLVPDYLTRVTDGAYYGWPFSYWGKHLDQRVQPQRPELVEKAIPPDYALGAHTASLGLTFYTATAFPAHYRGGAFIGQHGSWNRSSFTGYKVIYIPFTAGLPSGPPEDFLSDFMPDNKTGIAHGRPVGVTVDKAGALLVADDSGNIIWRVAKN